MGEKDGCSLVLVGIKELNQTYTLKPSFKIFKFALCSALDNFIIN